MPNGDLMWWGYLHQNGSIQVKRWFGDPNDYQDDCYHNEFFLQVVKPFPSPSREVALEHITKEVAG